MRVAVIQLKASSNKRRSIEKAVKFVERSIAKKAKFILLPEVFNYRGALDENFYKQSVAEKIPGDSIVPLQELAKKHKVSILAGSIFEKSATKKVYNTSVFIDRSGKCSGVYRKMNLFHAVIGRKKIRESDRFLKGKKQTCVTIKGLKVGLSICYDLRFPEFYKQYSAKGCQILCVPSAFTSSTGKAHWEVLLRARAIENLSYVLAPNQIGKDARGVDLYGHSMIVDPWGKVIAQASKNKEEILIAEIDKKLLKEKRKLLPSI